MDDERDEWFQLRCGCFHKGGSILVKSSYCCLLYLILPFLPLLMNTSSGRLFNNWKFLWIFSKGRQPLCIVLSYIITMSWLWETKCFLFFLNVAIHIAEMDVIILQIHWKLKFLFHGQICWTPRPPIALIVFLQSGRHYRTFTSADRPPSPS